MREDIVVGSRGMPDTRRSRLRPAHPLIALFGLLGLLLSGCSSGGNTASNPVPTITSLSPSSATAGGAPFTLTLDGTNFIASSTVQWNGAPRTTTFVNGTQLTASISAADIASAATVAVTVVNPAPGGGTSSAASFTIAAGDNPVPAITSLSPFSVTAELTGFALTVNGTGFVAGSVGQWNGANRATIVMSSTQLLFAPLPADNATVGDAQVSVVNPAPGGGTSNLLGILVSALPPDPIGVTDRLSVASDSAEANGGDSGFPAISSDGRFVVFESAASNLVPGDSNGYFDIFERDTCRGAPVGCTPSTVRVSVANDGSEGNDDSGLPGVSSDGRFIVFGSDATNLVSGDSNGTEDIFVRDTCSGAPAGCTPSTARVSVASDGSEADGTSGYQAISSNGRFVVFASIATNLVSDDSNSLSDIFVRDTCTGAPAGCTPSTTRVSVASDGSEADGNSFEPAIGADGRFIAFRSDATNLVSGDTNGVNDIFVRDTCVGATGCTPSTFQVSVDSAGVEGNDTSFLPRISGNGRFVVFTSWATNLVANDTNNGHDVFLRDTCFGASGACTPSTVRVSVDSSGNQADAPSGGPATNGAAISADGRFVAFGSRATNLVSGDTNDLFDIFVRDTCVGASGCTPATFRVSVALDGTESVDRSDVPAITADGRFVVFQSISTAFLPGDTNSSYDVFLARTGKP
jgi:Tol biopolymer transport system component